MNHSTLPSNANNPVIIYTDGSCHTQLEIGVWGAIILWGNEKIILQGMEHETTHNRMELTAVIKAIEHAVKIDSTVSIEIYTDSQYATRIPERKSKLQQESFITSKGNPLPNTDLIRQLINLTENYPITFLKVKAHQKKGETENFNREVDILVRKKLREIINNDGEKVKRLKK